MMLAEVEEVIEEQSEEITEEQSEEREMPSFNHSYICAELIEQINENKTFKALPELTLEIGKGLTPDISVYLRETIKPNFLHDFLKYPEMPILAIEVISASQNIQDLLDKSRLMVENGVSFVWTIEPFTNTIFVTTKDRIERFQSGEIENEGIKVDFRRIFSGQSA